MKYLLIMIGLGIVVSCMNEKEKGKAKMAGITKISIIEDTFDFGVITMADSVSHDFPVVNIGSEDLIISNIKTSCGCTVTDWDKNPIKPGDTTFVHVKFRPVAPGQNEKMAVMNSNIDSLFSILFIRGKVIN